MQLLVRQKTSTCGSQTIHDIAGKSSIMDCTATALSLAGTKHALWRMNPKAITASQMFGRMDSSTGAQLISCSRSGQLNLDDTQHLGNLLQATGLMAYLRCSGAGQPKIATKTPGLCSMAQLMPSGLKT